MTNSPDWTPPTSNAVTTKAERRALGKQALKSALTLFRQNRQMIWLPVMAGFAAAVVFLLVSGAIAIPLFAGGHHAFKGWVEYLVLLPGLFASSFVTIYANVALCFAAREQIEGRSVSITQALHLAASRVRVIVGWAVVSAIVGTVIRFIEQRAGLVGKALGFFGGVAWAVATFMIIPVLAFEEIGPLKAIERSGSLLKSTFGVMARSSLRFGALLVGWILLAVGVIVVGVVMIGAHQPVGYGVVVIGALGFFAISMYASAAGMYLRTVLYRYATGQPVPDLGVDFHALLGLGTTPKTSITQHLSKEHRGRVR